MFIDDRRLSMIYQYIDELEIYEKDWEVLNNLLDLEGDIFLVIMNGLTNGDIEIMDLEKIFETDNYNEVLLKNLRDYEEMYTRDMAKIIDFVKEKKLNFDNVYFNYYLKDSIYLDQNKMDIFEKERLRSYAIDALAYEDPEFLKKIDGLPLLSLIFGPRVDFISMDEKDVILTKQDFLFMSENNIDIIEMKKIKAALNKTLKGKEVNRL